MGFCASCKGLAVVEGSEEEVEAELTLLGGWTME